MHRRILYNIGAHYKINYIYYYYLLIGALKKQFKILIRATGPKRVDEHLRRGHEKDTEI